MVNLEDYKQVSSKILNRFIEQLFAHLGGIQTATGLTISAPDWIGWTRDSYKLWLSYAMLGIPEDTPRLHMEGFRLTERTLELRQQLDQAPQQSIEEYYDWAFPRSYADLWRQNYEGEYRKFLVSPVHFWFFVHCRQRSPSRQPRPKTANELFRHPFFFIAKHSGPFALVVPECFFDEHASFDRLRDLGSTPYYIFPYFAKLLFKYTELPPAERRTQTFGMYYSSRETAWFVPAGSADEKLIKPHPVLRLHWRWEDVLEMMMRSPKEPSPKDLKSHPKWCKNPPPGYGQDPRIVAYLDCFGNVAYEWTRRRGRVEPTG